MGKEKRSPKITVTVINNQNTHVKDAVIEIKQKHILEKLNQMSFDKLSVYSDDQCPSQTILKDGKINRFLFLCDLLPGEKKRFSVIENSIGKVFPKRTQAEISIKEGGQWTKVVKNNGNKQFKYKGGTFNNVTSLKVPEQHTDHSFYIRYEGPGWESDKVAYRIYLDWRNAIDVFGKKKEKLALQNIGLDGFESYHKMADWGVDVLKVGKSLGMGSVAYWNNNKANRVAKTDSIKCDIDYSGLIESKITTHYYGWDPGNSKLNLKSELSIQAGSHLTKHQLTLSDQLNNLCTGIVKNKNAEIIISQNRRGNWNYIATFGKQSLEDDNLGMFIFYRKNDLIKTTEDQWSHVIVLKPDNNLLTYYLGAAWEMDTSNIKTKTDFIDFLEEHLERLNSPLKIKAVSK